LHVSPTKQFKMTRSCLWAKIYMSYSTGSTVQGYLGSHIS